MTFYHLAASVGTFIAVACMVAACGVSTQDRAPGAAPLVHDTAVGQAPRAGDAANHAHHDHAHAEGSSDAGHDHGSAHHGHGAVEVAHEAQLAVEQGRRELAITLGPFLLPAARSGHVMRVVPGIETPMPHDAVVTGFDWRVVDAEGTALPRDLLHHLNVMLPERRELFRPTMQRLLAAGHETGEVRLPWPFGIRIDRGEPLLVSAMMHNESARDYGEVYVQATLYVRNNRLRGVQPFMFDVKPPPGPASWDLPPGRSERSWEGRPAVDVYLLGIGGHIHRYGEALILEDVTSGRVLHRSVPVLDEEGHVVSVPTRAFWPRGIRLRTDHVYRITAVYDNPTDAVIPDGAMGVFGGIVRPLADWPAADADSPYYLEDLSRHRPGADQQQTPASGDTGSHHHH
jgi:hypothetical protein